MMPSCFISSRGYILLLALVVNAVLFTVTAGLVNYATAYVRTERATLARAQAFTLAEAGIDKAIYELNQNGSYAGETGLALGNGSISITVVSVDSNVRRITATAYVPNSTAPRGTRTITVLTSVNTSLISFHYGVQVGGGGVTTSNGSKVNGSLYANGNISGSGIITGDAIAAGTSTITGVTVEGDATAHSMSSCSVLGDATYGTATTNCSVSGTKYPNSPDTATTTFPISAAQITDWEATAASGGTIAGPYTVSGTATLGPKMIDGNLTIGNGGHLILSGPVWVKGNLIFSNNSQLSVDAGTGSSGAIIIADVPGSTATLGTIDLSNNMTVSGNGNTNSYPMAITTNTGAAAIEMGNNANSIILYAPYGTVLISNGAGANQITAYQLNLSNNATINYLSGLQNSSFSNGPGGAWAVLADSYAIIQ